MEIELEFSIVDKEKTHRFKAKRLAPFAQFNFILKIISIISKGGGVNSAKVEQFLHDAFSTGVQVEGGQKKVDASPLNLILDAIKGGLAELSDADRDLIISTLLKGCSICDSSEEGLKKGFVHFVPATIQELNEKVSGFKPIIEILAQLVKINLGFS